MDAYTALVRADHYDPVGSPANVEALRKAGVTQEKLRSLLLASLGKQTPECILCQQGIDTMEPVIQVKRLGR